MKSSSESKVAPEIRIRPYSESGGSVRGSVLRLESAAAKLSCDGSRPYNLQPAWKPEYSSWRVIGLQ